MGGACEGGAAVGVVGWYAPVGMLAVRRRFVAGDCCGERERDAVCAL